MNRWIGLTFSAVLVLAVAAAAWGHETDQYAVPPGRQMADLGDYFTRWFYEAIERGVTKTNERIRLAIHDRKGQEYIRSLQTQDEIVRAVNAEFPNALFVIEGLDFGLDSPETRATYPGRLPAFKAIPANLTTFSLNPLRGMGCVSLTAFGVQLGADKIGHFTDMGMNYYKAYREARSKGASDEQAMRRAIEMGTDDPVFGESKFLGYWTSADYSNADLSVNYLGLLFYRNLTEPQMLKGELRPPMLLRDGEYWTISPHVRPDSDFFSWFISDHLDEALNSGLFLPEVRGVVRERAAQNFQGIFEHRTDRWGNRRSQAWFAKREQDLRTYWGFDYGHRGKDEELVLLSQLCFPEPKPSAAHDQVGRTALHRAVARGDLRAVQQLLASGADINAPQRSGESIDSNWGDTPLHVAVQDGQQEIVRLLIEKGADVNRQNDRGNTPLHRAVEFPNVMKLLLDAGAKTEIADVQGRTPLHWASMGIGQSAVALLLDRGAKIAARDKQGQTPLHLAARYADASGLQLLLDRGADPDAGDRFGARPLHIAAAMRQGEAAKTLLRAGAMANAQDEFGCTALHDAARRGAQDVVAVLLDAGAGPAMADASGTTPLHLACRRGYSTVAFMLARRGASPVLAAGKRGTPIDEARRGGYNDLADELVSMPQVAAFQY